MDNDADGHHGKRKAADLVPQAATFPPEQRASRVLSVRDVLCGPPNLLRRYILAHAERNSPLPIVLRGRVGSPEQLEYLEEIDRCAKLRVVDGTLMITEYPSAGHEAASTRFLCCVQNAVVSAGLGAFLDTKGSALIRDRASHKLSGYQPDQSFLYSLSDTTTPSLVLEIGWSESLSSLCATAKWYLDECKSVQAVVLMKFYTQSDPLRPPRGMLAVVVRRGVGVVEAVSFGLDPCPATAQDALKELHLGLIGQAGADVQVTVGTSITLRSADLFHGAKDNVDELLVTLESAMLRDTFKDAAEQIRKAISDGATWPMPDITVSLVEIRGAVLRACR